MGQVTDKACNVSPLGRDGDIADFESASCMTPLHLNRTISNVEPPPIQRFAYDCFDDRSDVGLELLKVGDDG